MLYIISDVITYITGTYYLFIYIYIYIYKIEILLYPNLSVYMCETPSWRLEPWPLPPTPHKHLYLWSDQCTKMCGGYYLYILKFGLKFSIRCFLSRLKSLNYVCSFTFILMLPLQLWNVNKNLTCSLKKHSILCLKFIIKIIN